MTLMEAETGAAYEREAPCNEEGDTNLAGNEVFEQVVALAGHALEYEKLALEPSTEGLDASLQRDQIYFAMQQVETNCRFLLFYAVLLIAMLLQVALQGILCRFQCSCDEDNDMEGSLAGGMVAAYGAKLQVVKSMFMVGSKACGYRVTKLHAIKR
ncbi:hypothetical protein GOP47_0007798 [Adiantum capillus-veneris]|uniref:Uncharacterized protein n=1 Tax=Adiantum capillus-veneris TaxID=13818 RepID=A0A9D4V1R7_ADICA|nr:hypothetical protein GOP47_0007798 [Adiantum capillus-veneris]